MTYREAYPQWKQRMHDECSAVRVDTTSVDGDFISAVAFDADGKEVGRWSKPEDEE